MNIENPNKKVLFSLNYSNLLIGYLEFENRSWKFYYSDQFKKQNEIAPLFQFPDIYKIYTAKHLWPYFKCRIPNLKQDRYKKIILKENISNNYADLLKRFGEYSIQNPFKLIYIEQQK